MALTVNQKFVAIVLGVVAVSCLVSFVFVSNCPVVFYYEYGYSQLEFGDAPYFSYPAPFHVSNTTAVGFFYMQPVPVNGVYLSPEVSFAKNLTVYTAPAWYSTPSSLPNH